MIKKLFSDVQIIEKSQRRSQPPPTHTIYIYIKINIYKIGSFPTTKLCIFDVYRGTRYASETAEYMISTLFWKNLKISAILLVILKNGVVVFEMNSLVVGNKAKGLISKQVFQENKARQISPWYAHVCVLFVFRKIWCALFSWNTRFKIRPFALLPT